MPLKKNNKISTGTPLDKLLRGGYEKDIITTIYGPAGTGKTNLCMMCLANQQKKTIYIDTDGGFSVERLKQVCKDYKEVLKRILFLRPVNFDEQKRVFERLKKLVNEKITYLMSKSV